MTTNSRRRDDIPGAIALIVLLIGTATGNAYALLALSVAALALLAAYYRRRAWPGPIVVALAAAGAAAVVAVLITAAR